MSDQDITENIIWKNRFARDREKKRKNNIAPCEVGKTCKYHRIMAQLLWKRVICSEKVLSSIYLRYSPSANTTNAVLFFLHVDM